MPRLPLAALLVLPAFSFVALPGCECGIEDDEVGTPFPEPTATPSPQNRGFYLSMALDSAGRPWLAYQERKGDLEGDAPLLNIARGTGDPAAFEHAQVDGAPDRSQAIPSGGFEGGFYADIVIGSDDVVHATHWNRTRNKLRYVRGTWDDWTAEDAADEGGEFASIALVDGEPVIAYYERESGELRVASRSGGSWTVETVDEGSGEEPDVGRYADLFVDASGEAHIAYQDVGNGDLKVASGGPGDWSVATWYEEGDVGAWPRLTESGGTLYVAFEDLGNRDLLWSDGPGRAEVVDGGDFVGPDSAIVWVDGAPVVLYHDGMNNDALMARKVGNQWVRSVHRSNGAVGFHNNVALGEDGRLNWACLDHTTTDIVFQRFELGEAR